MKRIALNAVFWLAAGLIWIAIDILAWKLYVRLRDDPTHTHSTTPVKNTRVAGDPADANTNSSAGMPSPGNLAGGTAVRLADGQRCAGGVVVDVVRHSDGSMAALQVFEFGHPVRCEGDHRLEVPQASAQ